MALVKIEWGRKSVPEKILKGEFIAQQMTANVAVFVTPNPPLVDVQAALEDLIQKAVSAQAGGYTLTYAKSKAEKEFDALIKQLVSYVQNVSGGDEGIILLSGMGVRKSPSSVPDPEQVQNLDAFPTRAAGKVQLDWDTLGRDYNYQVEMWRADDSGSGFWDKIAVQSKSKYTVTGLTTGKVYRFRVAGIGKDDTVGPFSQEATSVAP